ncbi:(2Fe-2S)-binding protein [Glutamicibacter sp. JL.03c]|uniref:(2Fe-2S)-binding protein n=1 Tax=Glutamicibacter sp. JL.03c TaxID=2984842 RepID=UPI0021F6B909|nr:(2Fe-2S)-binding protein [Glutamicibacter sp. JL.03c]UYQ76552.1 (2Fe-2S)-binding protein [Glutamicibacter sp. JL.03c]
MKRIENHPVLGPLAKNPVDFVFNDQPYTAIEGDSVVSALLANDIRALRRTRGTGQQRGVYCGIGHCYECRLTVDGDPGVRACLTPVADGMILASPDDRRAEGDG